MPHWDPTTWRFDIDRLLNRFVPPPPWQHIPYPVAYFFGHRKQKPRDIGNVVPIFWAFIGVFCAVSVIEVVSERIPEFKHRGAPVIVGSFVSGSPSTSWDPGFVFCIWNAHTYLSETIACPV